MQLRSSQENIPLVQSVKSHQFMLPFVRRVQQKFGEHFMFFWAFRAYTKCSANRNINNSEKDLKQVGAFSNLLPIS